MNPRAWAVAAFLSAALIGGAFASASESVSTTAARLRVLVAQADAYGEDEAGAYGNEAGAYGNDEAMSPEAPSAVPNPQGQGKLSPPGDEVLGGQGPTGGEAVEGGEAVSPGSAVTGSNSGLSSGPTTPEPRAGTEPDMPPPGPTPEPQPGYEEAQPGYEEEQPGYEEEAQPGEAQPGEQAQPQTHVPGLPGETAEEEAIRARISELEESLAEQQAAQEEQAAQSDQRISELENDLDALQQRGAFLEQNRTSRIQRLQSGIDGMRYVFQVLSVGSSDLDGDLAQIADELEGAATDAARYAGPREAALAARSQAWVQAAREAIARNDLYAARINLGQAMADARDAQAAAADGSQQLFR